MINRIDTTPILDRERMEYWMQVVCRYYPQASGRRPDSMPFSAQLERTVLGPIEVSDIRCCALRYERKMQDLRADSSEDFLVSYILDGEARCVFQPIVDSVSG